MRLDIWLDIACLYRTRSEAQKACTTGKIDVNGEPAKPHRRLSIDDQIVLQRPRGVRQRVVVRALADRHLPKAQARELYVDVTPPPTPEELEALRMARLTGPFPDPRHSGALDKRDRRELRRLKERN